MREQAQFMAAWDREYAAPGIPSSIRREPSGSVVEFVRYLEARDGLGKTAIDLGCGTGRNALYLSGLGITVHALDFAAGPLDQLRRQSATLARAHPVVIHQQSVTDPWPVEDASLDIGLDTFCYKHQITAQARRKYRQELARTLKPGGYFLLTLAGIDDGYYGPLLRNSPDPGGNVIVDPANQIQSVLFTPAQVREEFAGIVEIVYHRHQQRAGLMHGRQYLRSTHVFYGRRT